MSTLHTINKSPFSHNVLSSCLQICGSGDVILLLEDGVFGALNSAPCAEEMSGIIARGIMVFALANDLKARGIADKTRSDVTVTDYNGFVELSIQYKCIQSWY